MDDLRWCFKQAKGIKLVEVNQDIAKAYLKDAKMDFGLINKKEPKWNIIKEYYVCYNSLYSLFARCGIKCEIHDCTLKLMPLFGFNEDFCNKMTDLKKERVGVQYYLGKSKRDYLDFAREFLEFCEIKHLELNDLQVSEIRNKLKELMK